MLKQMKLIYAQGFSKAEKLEWKPVIFNNIVQSFRLIFDAMNDLGLKLDSEDNEVSAISTVYEGGTFIVLMDVALVSTSSQGPSR